MDAELYIQRQRGSYYIAAHLYIPIYLSYTFSGYIFHCIFIADATPRNRSVASAIYS